MIKLTNVTKHYGKEKALNNITLSLEKGKIYGLLGPNGSGKSTLLKLIAGLNIPTSGTILVNEEVVDRRISHEIAYLTELDQFYPNFKVKDMIKFYQSQFKDFNMEKANELITFMKLDADKQIKQLSKGNRGRLKLVITLARDASVILLDEPFSGLDPMVRDSIVKGLLTYLDFETQTVIVATHEVEEIEPVLDKIVALKNGSIIAEREVDDIRETDQLTLQQWMKNTLA